MLAPLYVLWYSENMEDRHKQKRLRIGWFSFTCSEDSSIVFMELMNDHWKEWKNLIDFRHARILKSKNVLEELDVAFIEGAIVTASQTKRLEEIRKKSKKLIAIGACAVTGLPAGQRDRFDEETKKEIQYLLDYFAHLPKVLKVSDVVKVDGEIPGCPMDHKLFLDVLNQLLKEFKVSK